MSTTTTATAADQGLLARLDSAAATYVRQQGRPGPKVPVLLIVAGPDVVALNDYVRGLCQAETQCTICEARVCEDCKVCDAVTCLGDPLDVHCRGCQDACPACAPTRGRPLPGATGPAAERRYPE